MNASRRAAPLALVAALLVAGCGGLPPELRPEPTVCPAALLEGTLVRADGSQLSVQSPDGSFMAVEWPDGWTVRDGDAGLELVDDSGQVVADEGSHIQAGGGMNLADSAFVPCGPIELTPAG